jgi:D-serine dehydratase
MTMTTVDQIVDREQLRSCLESIEAVALDGRAKGFPPGGEPCSITGLAGRNWNVLHQNLPFPVCVARLSAIDGNRAWMRGFLQRAGVALAPHAKTTMSPQLLQMQVDDGAWAFCVATAQQAAILRSFGVRRIVIANQIAGHANIDYIFSELNRDPALEIYALIDSREGLDSLLERARRVRGPGCLRLLVEVGAEGGRTGTRSVASAVSLAEGIAKSGSSVQLSGVEAYESVFPTLDPELRLQRIEQMLDRVLQVADTCRERDLFGRGSVVLSAGGSEYFDRVAERLKSWSGDAVVVLRSGCYIAHDDLAYARAFERLKSRSPQMCPSADSLTGALEVWGAVQSRPEPELALITVGKRDVSFDFEMPVPLRWYKPGSHSGVQAMPHGHSIVRLNDQHAFLQCPANSPIAVGDLVGLGISHPCTTFDKWSLIYTVNDAYDVCGALRTYF